jgi:hypothetical protein
MNVRHAFSSQKSSHIYVNKEQWKGEKNAMKVNKTYTKNEKKLQA